ADGPHVASATARDDAGNLSGESEPVGFDVDTNEVTLVTRSGAEAVPLQSKARIAAIVLDHVEQLLLERRAAVSNVRPSAD
ncbi:MAG: hypothetical protein ABL982_23700, partial [Vicinamibacterales bacterium]